MYKLVDPQGLTSFLVYATVERHGYEGLQIATLISGVLLIAMALLKCGRAMKYVPQPVIAGFTAGIAVVILSSQLRDFFGLNVEGLPPQFIDKCLLFCQEAHSFNGVAVALATLTTLSLFVFKKYFPKIPGAIVALALSSLVVSLFSLPVETIEGRFGALPSPIPPFSPPGISLKRIIELFPDGFAIALLGAIESLLAASIADRMTGYRHKSNAELMGQGIANFFSALFGGIPATGAIARTSASIRLGAKTPLAGMIHAITLFFAVFFFASYAGKIPLATLAGILTFVAWNMGEFSYLIKLARAHQTDGIILFLTLLITVLVDLTFAVEVGIVLSVLAVLRQIAKRTTLKLIPDGELGRHLLKIEGPFFFSVGEELKKMDLPNPCHEVWIDCEKITLIDTSAALAIKECSERWKSEGVNVSLNKLGPEWIPLFHSLGIVVKNPSASFSESNNLKA